MFPLSKADLYWIPYYLYLRHTCTGFLAPCSLTRDRLKLDSLIPLPKTASCWIPCSQHSKLRPNSFIPLSEAVLYRNQGRQVQDFCSLNPMQAYTRFLTPLIQGSLTWFLGRHVLDSLYPLSKADMNWIPHSPYPRQTCTRFLIPFIQGQIALDYLFPLPRQTFTGFLVPNTQGRLLLNSLLQIPKADFYWIPCSKYLRQTLTGFLVPIIQGRLSLDSLFQIPKTGFYWTSCSKYPRQTLLDFLFQIPEADFTGFLVPNTRGRLLLDSLF